MLPEFPLGVGRAARSSVATKSRCSSSMDQSSKRVCADGQIACREARGSLNTAREGLELNAGAYRSKNPLQCPRNASAAPMARGARGLAVSVSGRTNLACMDCPILGEHGERWPRSPVHCSLLTIFLSSASLRRRCWDLQSAGLADKRI